MKFDLSRARFLLFGFSDSITRLNQRTFWRNKYVYILTEGSTATATSATSCPTSSDSTVEHGQG
jgi:hypothetical protein